MSEIPIRIQLELTEAPEDIEARLAAIDRELERKPGALREVSVQSRETSTRFKELSISASDVVRRSKELTGAYRVLAEERAKSLDALQKYIAGEKMSSAELARARRAARMMMSAQARLLDVTRRIGIELFWLGLGSMFIVMSYARWRRSALAVESAQLTLRRATMSLAEAQRRANEAVRIYGMNSREARMAILDLEEAKLAYKLALDRVRSSLEQQTYQMWIFILGAAPTMIRAIFALTNLWVDYYAAQVHVATGLDMVTIKSMIATGALKIQIPILKGVELGYWGVVAAQAAFSLGVTAVVAALSYWYTETFIINPQLERMKKNLKEVEDVLTGHSLVDSLRIARKETNLFMKSVNELSDSLTGHSLVDSLEASAIEADNFTNAISQFETPRVQEITLEKKVVGVEGNEVESIPEEIKQKIDFGVQANITGSLASIAQHQLLELQTISTNTLYNLLIYDILQRSIGALAGPLGVIASGIFETTKETREIKRGLGIHSPAEIRIVNISELQTGRVEAPAPPRIEIKEEKPLPPPEINIPAPEVNVEVPEPPRDQEVRIPEIRVSGIPEIQLPEIKIPSILISSKARIPEINVPNLEEPKPVNVNIVIQGPFYIREEADIIKLASRIGRLQMSRMTRIRGRV